MAPTFKWEKTPSDNRGRKASVTLPSEINPKDAQGSMTKDPCLVLVYVEDCHLGLVPGVEGHCLGAGQGSATKQRRPPGTHLMKRNWKESLLRATSTSRLAASALAAVAPPAAFG